MPKTTSILGCKLYEKLQLLGQKTTENPIPNSNPIPKPKRGASLTAMVGDVAVPGLGTGQATPAVSCRGRAGLEKHRQGEK